MTTYVVTMRNDFVGGEVYNRVVGAFNSKKLAYEVFENTKANILNYHLTSKDFFNTILFEENCEIEEYENDWYATIDDDWGYRVKIEIHIEKVEMNKVFKKIRL